LSLFWFVGVAIETKLYSFRSHGLLSSMETVPWEKLLGNSHSMDTTQWIGSWIILVD
jgi:hypothetical protein